MGKHFMDEEKDEDVYQIKIKKQHKNTEKGNKGRRILIRTLIVILMIFAVLAGIATCFVGDKLGKIQKELNKIDDGDSI